MPPDNATYKGRFAPTPSGPLHIGGLLAAVGGFLRARAHGGRWHVRIDDIDPPRVVAGAADSILRTLERYGLHWDGAVVYQSRRREHYQAALRVLQAKQAVYPCGCSRKAIEAVGARGPNGVIYPGTCRPGPARAELIAGKTARALRLLVADSALGLTDLIQGDYGLHLRRQVGDFVVRRADGVFAYHLATVVDDGLDDFTEITRGRDLLSVTPQQIALQRALDLPTPRYAHLPLLTDNSGAKLCKRTGAKAVDEIDKHAVLKTIFRALGLPVINEVIAAEDETRWRWAVRHWDMAKVARADVAVDVEGLQGACN